VFYTVQEVMKHLCGRDPHLASRLSTTRSALSNLAANGVIEVAPAMAARLNHPDFDTSLVDTYLHTQDRPFTAGEIHQLLGDYDPALYFTDSVLAERAASLEPERVDLHARLLRHRQARRGGGGRGPGAADVGAPDRRL